VRGERDAIFWITVMDDPVLWSLPVIGLIGGFLSGLLGLGGGVILLPLMTLVGKVPFKLATGTTLIHVFLAALTGMFLHYREGMVDFKAGFLLGGLGILGGLLGSLLSAWLSVRFLEVVFLLVVALSMVLLFVPLKLKEMNYVKGGFNKLLGSAIGFGVGILTGLLGVGGGFVMIPLMTYLLNIPFRITIGTSLLIILISSAGTLGAKYEVGHIDLSIAAMVVSGGVMGAWVGASISRRVPVRFLRFILFSTLVVIFIAMGYKTFF